MQMDTVIRLSDIPMPAGVTATGDPDSPVVTVLTMRAEMAEIEAADAEVAEEQAEESAEGEAEGERGRHARVATPLPRATPPRSEAQDPVRLADRRTGQPGQGVRPHRGTTSARRSSPSWPAVAATR